LRSALERQTLDAAMPIPRFGNRVKVA